MRLAKILQPRPTLSNQEMTRGLRWKRLYEGGGDGMIALPTSPAPVVSG